VNDEIRSCIAEGLYTDNLLRIAALCDERFDEHPTLYGTLAYMCQTLADRFGPQAILTQRYDLINQMFQPRLFALLDVVSGPPDLFLDALTELWRTFRALP